MIYLMRHSWRRSGPPSRAAAVIAVQERGWKVSWSGHRKAAPAPRIPAVPLTGSGEAPLRVSC